MATESHAGFRLTFACVEIGVMNLEIFRAVELQVEKGDGSIFRDKGEKKASYFWLKNLSDGLNLLTSFLSQILSINAFTHIRIESLAFY
jgi:hypothetical protein